jgi:hypothetical protein
MFRCGCIDDIRAVIPATTAVGGLKHLPFRYALAAP